MAYIKGMTGSRRGRGWLDVARWSQLHELQSIIRSIKFFPERKHSQIQLDIPLTPSSRSGCLRAGLRRHARALGHRGPFGGLAASGLLLLLRRWAVPVVQHLGREDHVESEASDEAVEDELVVNFLEGGEDAGEGASKVIEDL